ncbi:hypothetical protein PV08_09673 [Exophiala spinifera]|uniref:Uncharacterized protein n=1 Tax=Exophiala spinifera TaxID=91928 RepID=A0A0D1YBU0_9EURO|nr:uncharacterized protein PV08_09673 [Exophiala spinifera]KIW12396.1 hypothetical protein PV08_09673 [Exophiala spinifera]
MRSPTSTDENEDEKNDRNKSENNESSTVFENHNRHAIVVHGNRPRYFRDRGTANLAAAWDEFLYLRLIVRNLESIYSRVGHLHKVLEKLIHGDDYDNSNNCELRSDSTRERSGTQFNDIHVECSEWLVDFIAWNPIPLLQGMVQSAKTIVEAHVAMSDGLIERHEVIRVVANTPGRQWCRGSSKRGFGRCCGEPLTSARTS